MTHSKLPWRQVDTTIEDADGNLIIECKHGTEEERLFNARYTVAAAKACAGMDVDVLEKHGLTRCRSGQEMILRDERDLLLAALNRLMACHGVLALVEIELEDGMSPETLELGRALLQAREAVRAVTP